MKKHFKCRSLTSVLLTILLLATLIVPMTLPVNAARKRFITELRVEAGLDAVATLEGDGWSVMLVGLNVTPDPASQVYLAFKQDTGAPITNVMASPDVGDTLTDSKGIVYTCVSHVDLDEGIDGTAGCLYATTDERAGAPLVGLDVIRGDSANGDVLYPITNDGAEVVRTPSGAPADLENTENTGVVYLAQIRDGIVRPYISEIGVVTDTDKWNAVYTACERGFNYYVEGDIDNSTDTYTIIAYDRTANPEDALTSVTAVSEATIRQLEEEQIIDSSTESGKHYTVAAITISGASYIRVSSQPVSAETPFYLYMTKDRSAGNPVSMIYAETPEQTQNFMFGMWANSYFFSPGKTTAYMYCMNEDLYMTLWEDQTVCTKVPVPYLDGFTRPIAVETSEENAADPETVSETAEESSGQPSDSGKETTDPAKPEADGKSDHVKYINLTMLTPRNGLPASAGRITGMQDPDNIAFVERTQRSDRVNKFQASVFSGNLGIALIAGGVVIAGAAAFVIIRKRSGKKVPAATGKTKK